MNTNTTRYAFFSVLMVLLLLSSRLMAASVEDMLLGNTNTAASVGPANKSSWIRYRGKVYGVSEVFDKSSGKLLFRAIKPDGKPARNLSRTDGQNLVWAYQMLHSIYMQPYKLNDLRELQHSVSLIRKTDKKIRYWSKFQDKLMQVGVATTAGYFFGADKSFKIASSALKSELTDAIKNAPVIAARNVAHTTAKAGEQRLESIIQWVERLANKQLATPASPADFEAIRSVYSQSVWVDVFMWPATELIIKLQPETDAVSQIYRMVGVVDQTVIGAISSKKLQDSNKMIAYWAKIGIEQLLEQGMYIAAISNQVPAMAEYIVTIEQRMKKWRLSITGTGENLPQNMAGIDNAETTREVTKPIPKQATPKAKTKIKAKRQQPPIKHSDNRSGVIRYVRVYQDRKSKTYRVVYGLYGQKGKKHHVPLHDRFVVMAKYHNKTIKLCDRTYRMQADAALKKITCTLPEPADARYVFTAILYHQGIEVARLVTTDNVQLSANKKTAGKAPQSGVDTDNAKFRISASKAAYGTDYSGVCTREFGKNWQLADWSDLKAYYAAGKNLQKLVEHLSFSKKRHAWVTRNGEQAFSSQRDYFASFHNHRKPGNYLAHDQIDKNFFSLGSWYGKYYVLCHQIPKQATPKAKTKIKAKRQQPPIKHSDNRSGVIRYVRVYQDRKSKTYRVVYGLYGQKGKKHHVPLHDRFVVMAKYHNKTIKLCDRTYRMQADAALKKITCTLPEPADARYVFTAILYHQGIEVARLVTTDNVQLSANKKTAGKAPQSGVDTDNAKFRISASKAAYGTDYSGVCTREFGKNWQLADWSDLKAYYAAGKNLQKLVEHLSFSKKRHAWVTRNGEQAFSSQRDYFASFHNHRKPGNYLAHDQIDKNFFSLGSWYGKYYVLCHQK